MAEPDGIHILGIVGSLSPTSINAALIDAVAELAPAHTRFERADLAGINVYDDALWKTQGVPAAVEALRAQIAAADAVVIATPEYNYSIPSLLKAALEWCSRPPAPPFSGKPVAIIGASGSVHGTVRGQLHLRQICVSLNAFAVNTPHVDVADAGTKFEGGRLVDPATRTAIAQLLAELARLALCLRRP